MPVVRWNPVRDLLGMQDDFNRAFNRIFTTDLSETSMTRGTWDPAVDITETGDSYEVTAELPGLTKDDVKIAYENGVVSIRGEKKQETEHKDKNYHRVERHYGQFERSFRLPATVQMDRIEAKFKDGILRLTLPKAEEVKPKEIPIKIS